MTSADRLVSPDKEDAEQDLRSLAVHRDNLELHRRWHHDPRGIGVAQESSALGNQCKNLLHLRASQQSLGDVVYGVDSIQGPSALGCVANEGGDVEFAILIDGSETYVNR